MFKRQSTILTRSKCYAKQNTFGTDPMLVSFRDRPLALYLFTSDSNAKKEVLTKTISGMAMINDVLLAAGGKRTFQASLCLDPRLHIVFVAVEGLGFGGTGAVSINE